jgi:four helix bundle protein
MYVPPDRVKFQIMREAIKSARDLEVYNTALAAALSLSRIGRRFPADERGLREQVRRVGRSPGASIAEAFRKRNYPDFWRNKLTDAQSEASEAQWWLDIALAEGYCTKEEYEECNNLFEKLIAQLSKMIGGAKSWIVPRP